MSLVCFPAVPQLLPLCALPDYKLTGEIMPLHRRLFDNIPALYALDASSTLPTLPTGHDKQKKGSRHCHVSLGTESNLAENHCHRISTHAFIYSCNLSFMSSTDIY